MKPDSTLREAEVEGVPYSIERNTGTAGGFSVRAKCPLSVFEGRGWPSAEAFSRAFGLSLKFKADTENPLEAIYVEEEPSPRLALQLQVDQLKADLEDLSARFVVVTHEASGYRALLEQLRDRAIKGIKGIGTHAEITNVLAKYEDLEALTQSTLRLWKEQT